MQTAIACFCSRELSTSKDNLFLQKSKCLTFHLRDNCSPLVNNESPPMIMQRNAGTLHSSLYFMKGNHRHAHLGGGTVSMRGEGEIEREREKAALTGPLKRIYIYESATAAHKNAAAGRRRRREGTAAVRAAAAVQHRDHPSLQPSLLPPPFLSTAGTWRYLVRPSFARAAFCKLSEEDSKGSGVWPRHFFVPSETE